jgi:biotin carboxylase
MTRRVALQPIRLLILSIGSLAAQNVVQALASRRDRVFVIGANSIADAAGNFLADVAYVVPPARSEAAYAASVERLIAEEKPDLVIPARDDDILVLARMKERLGPEPVLLVGSLAAAEIMDDKKKTAEFAARHGLPFAPTADALTQARQLGAAHGFPLIGKPRSGNGARGVIILRSEAELERAFARRPDLVVQPFFDLPPDGTELLADFDAGLPFFYSFPESAQYVTQMIIGPDGAGSEICATRNIQIHGQSVVNERIHDRELIALAEKYGEAIKREGWIGPVQVQAKRTADGAFVVFEMNGRFNGATAACTLLGLDELAIVIRSFLPGVPFPDRSRETARLVQKAPSSYPLPSAALEELKRTGRWERGRQTRSDSSAFVRW